MAIRALNSVIVANYDTAANASWHAGACLARDTSNVGRVVLADRASGAIAGGFVGFSADDTARTDNTMILADPVGSNYIDGSGVFQSNNNGFYVAAKRAIGDFQAENVNGVTNLSAQSSGYEGPRRGVGVFNTPGGQFVTDQFTSAATSAAGTDGSTATYAPGAYLTVAVDDSGKLVELANKAHGPVVGIVDKYDSAAGLLYFTQAYFERAI
jgi:bifunctional ADP-heptose synthase (sugar kinase/adenylyltransferase)